MTAALALALLIPSSDASAQPAPPNSVTTNENVIGITFHPQRSSRVGTCTKITFIQFMRPLLGGNAVKPSAINPDWAYKDAVTTPDGWLVDHRTRRDNTPSYIDEPPDLKGDRARLGFGYKDPGGAMKTAEMGDTPNLTPPPGRDVFVQFSAFAWCMAGPECGKWYEGISWTYAKGPVQLQAGHPNGVAAVFNPNLTAGPDKFHLDAFALFNANRKFTPCK